ncbi:MAG: glycosyltransferase [Planctomycetota bacterium]|nr:glycosyltransferase [Planctomycetota bacterium]
MRGFTSTASDRRPRVWLTATESHAWALETDRRILLAGLRGWAEVVDRVEDAEIVHAVWWEPLVDMPAERLLGKRIVCQLSGEPFRYLGLPRFRHVVPRIGRWIAQSEQAARQLNSIGFPFSLIPYAVDTSAFRPLAAARLDRTAARARWNLPADSYLIGSFQRDSEGKNLLLPKLVKGPDVFLEIVRGLHAKEIPIHCVLAGPRRHWLRAQLSSLGIPFTQIGKVQDNDDFPANACSPEQINELYNLLDLYLVTSRSEGGPRGLLEAAAAQCPILSTPVGLAPEVLQSRCLYATTADAIRLVEADFHERVLAQHVAAHSRRVESQHTISHARPRIQQLYADRFAVKRHVQVPHVPPHARSRPRRNWWHRLLRPTPKTSLTVGLWHKYVKPPYGGGNQFMIALRKGLQQRGVTVLENCIDPRIDAYVLNSVHFDVDRFTRLAERQTVPIVHRIDGPIHLIRGRNREQDDLCYALNRRFAAVTVLQSSWTYRQIAAYGYEPVSPVIVHNGVDPEIFYPQASHVERSPSEKIRLIATSWSDNANKGGELYRWLEQHIDRERYEFTFVGRTSVPLELSTVMEPVPSEELANIVRQHDIYITASANDPCSNALIEALSCGLPALYRNDGGHPELVGTGGLPFEGEHDVISQLERLAADLPTFRRLVRPPRLDVAVEAYLELLRDVSAASEHRRVA